MRNLLEFAIALLAAVLAVLLYVRWTRKKQAVAADQILQQSQDPAMRERLQQRIRHEAETYAEEPLDEEAIEEPVETGPVNETVSLVLRRQIPPSDAPARSWLGGLPTLPDDIEWPRGVNPEFPDRGAVPLHFVAQVCCEDLPAELWGGHGPRQGWLRLFVNGNSSENEDPGLWRIVHSAEPGSEREPPADIGPIHDGSTAGGSPWTQANAVYPRWPVDLVNVANTLRHQDGRSFPTPDSFESVLYPGKRVQHDPRKLPRLAPYSRSVLRDGLRAVIASFSQAVQPKVYDAALLAKLGQPENMALIRADAEKPGNEALAELLAQCPTAQALVDRCSADEAEWIEWRAEVVQWLEEWVAAIKKSTLDDPLIDADRQRIELIKDAPAQQRWVIASKGDYGDLPACTGPRLIELSLPTILADAWNEAGHEAMVRYYLDPAKRWLVPDVQISAFEAYWRTLHDNIPHRIGGYHDGVQSDAVEGAQDMLLLFQIATDRAAKFCWGDAGAIYAFVSPADLDACQFDSARFQLECH